jgi:RNA polymerase sigma-70 factor (ECF subfamily)
MRRGELTALESAYRKYADRLYTYALSASGNTTVAEDAVADVFVRLYTFLSAGGEIHNLKSFFFTAVRNAVRDSYRREVRDLPLPEEDLLEDIAPGLSRRLIIEDALNQLPPDEREIIQLHCYGGFLHREIAGLLGLPEGTVRWKYRKGISTLRSILGGAFE